MSGNDPMCGELYQYGPQPEVAPLPGLPPAQVCDGSGVVSHIVCGSPAPGEWIEEGGWLHYYPNEPAAPEEDVPEGTVTVGEIETVWVGDSGYDTGGGWFFGGGFFGGGFFGGSVSSGGTVTVGDIEQVAETVIQ